ncbi:gap junction gamma-3 protein isoform X3 [Erinaceus europaeus]|uniref:Gap junction gamma-3 protein isoform X3 n=1 Tax=Erinaceus europaeus TaxID=9365 RepID=A0ABM3VYE1_ERIEU|nr:gap junction gamma-3 protein isoform X3 [Erinaceus europaeus]
MSFLQGSLSRSSPLILYLLLPAPAHLLSRPVQPCGPSLVASVPVPVPMLLRQLLAEGGRPCTPVGRLLLPAALGLRLGLLVACGPGVFGDDERSGFECHTQEPGCRAACYDAFHPLSPLCFWAFQVLVVAVPSALYLGLTLHQVPNSITCRREPCLGSITCHLSRPSEKSIFLKTMFGVSGLCLSLTLLELVLLALGVLWRAWKAPQSPLSNYFRTLKNFRTPKEPSTQAPVVETKEQREAEL